MHASKGDRIPPCGVPFVGTVCSPLGSIIGAFSISLIIHSSFLSLIPNAHICRISFVWLMLSKNPLISRSTTWYIFIDNISDDTDSLRLRELSNASLFIASKQKINILLGGQRTFKKIAAVPATITISYNSRYHETTTIDINQYAFMLSYKSSEEDISQHVKKMQEHDFYFHKQLVKAVEDLHSPVLQNVIVP